MMWRLITPFAAAVMLAATTQALSAETKWGEDCAVPSGFTSARLLDELPPVLKQTYKSAYSPDQDTPCCDIPLLRLLFAWHRGAIWIVGYRAEAFADSEGVDVMRLDSKGDKAATIRPDSQYHGRACFLATAYANERLR